MFFFDFIFIFSQVYDIIIRSWKNYKAGDTVSKHKPEKPSGIKKFEDITSSSKPSGVKGTLSFWYKYKFKPFFLRDHKRNLKVTVSIIGCFAVLLVLCVALYANNLFGMMKPEGYSGDENATFVEDEDVSYKSMYDITDADSLKDLLRSWATNNGEKLSSKNVINVLLIGEDDDNGSHRSDTMILVSLNKKTKKITLTSFLRDSYTYMNINGSERFDKINHSYGWGGTDALIQTLENNQHWHDFGYEVVQGNSRIGDKMEIVRPKANSPLIISDKQKPEEIIKITSYDGMIEEIDAVAEDIYNSINTEKLHPDDIIVITLDDKNSKIQLKLLSDRLRARGIESFNLTDRSYSKGFIEEGCVTLSTVYRAKGNEAAQVYVMGTQIFENNSNRRSMRNRIFTAFTRAKGWLKISGVNIKDGKLWKEVEKVFENGFTLKFLQTEPRYVIERDKKNAKNKKNQV